MLFLTIKTGQETCQIFVFVFVIIILHPLTFANVRAFFGHSARLRIEPHQEQLKA
jgi:hypothetical protein